MEYNTLEKLDNITQKKTFLMYVRKEILGVSRKKFASALGIAEITITKIETDSIPASKNIFLSLYILLLQYKSDNYLYYPSKNSVVIDDAIEYIAKKYIDINYLRLF